MKGTVFAVALNHRSQTEAWRDVFQHQPYKTPPKTPVWFIKPRNTVIGNGDSIPLPPAEQVFSGATLALVIRQTARKVSLGDAADYIAGFALANDVSLPETTFYRPAIKAKCRDGFCPVGEMIPLTDISSLDIVTEINGQQVDCWNTADLNLSAVELLSDLSDFITLQPGDVILLGTPLLRVRIQPGDILTLKAAGFPALVNCVHLQQKKTGETA